MRKNSGISGWFFEKCADFVFEYLQLMLLIALFQNKKKFKNTKKPQKKFCLDIVII